MKIGEFYERPKTNGAKRCRRAAGERRSKAWHCARRWPMRITNTIADLRRQIHDDLRRQNPEWVLPNGESPMCDAYEALLMDLLAPDRTEWQRIGN